MLHLNKLVLDHFMCVTHAELDFSADKVIVLNGPNGQGKSTIQAAVALCLTEEKRGNSYSEFVQSGFRGATIQLDAEIKYNPIHFEIIIDTKGSGLTRTADYNNKKYTNSEVSDLLKSFDIDYFADIIMSTQGNTDDIIRISPKERQRYLQKLLNFDFDNELLQCKNKIDEFEKMINENRSIVKFSNESIDSKNKEIRDVNVLDFTEQDIQRVQNELNELNTKVSGLSSISAEKNTYVNEISKHKESIARCQSEINEYHRKINEIAENTLKKENLKKEIEKLDQEYKAICDAISEESNKELLPQVSYFEEIEKQRLEEYYKLKNESEEALKHINLVKQGKCPTCGKEFDIENIGKYEHEYEVLKTNSEMKYVEVENMRRLVKQSRAEEQEHNDKLKKLDADSRSNLRVKSLKENELNSINTNNESEYFSAIAAKQQEIDNENKLIEELNAKCSEIDIKIASYSEISKELTEKNACLSNMNKQVYENNIILENNAKVRQSIIELKDKVAASEKLIEGYITQEKVYDEVDAMFRKTFPNYLIVKTCAKLEDEMNDFIQIVFPQMAVRLFQDRAGVGFYYTTNSSKISKWTKDEMLNVKMASGFEKSVLSIAFKVALCKAYNLPFAFLDEIDCFGDDTNSERLFESLVGGGLFDQLFIISHKENVKSMIENRAKNFKMYYVKSGCFSQEEM